MTIAAWNITNTDCLYIHTRRRHESIRVSGVLLLDVAEEQLDWYPFEPRNLILHSPTQTLDLSPSPAPQKFIIVMMLINQIIQQLKVSTIITILHCTKLKITYAFTITHTCHVLALKLF